jgi:DNA-binding transcriptional ArsR family regulator
MSAPAKTRSLSTDLYTRLAGLLAQAKKLAGASGFTDPDAQDDAGLWRPLGELPAHIFDRNCLENAAGFCLFGGRAYVGVNAGRLTEWERARLAGTRQSLTVILNRMAAFEVAYDFDGSAGWLWFPLDIPAMEIGAVEIERDGKLLFSAFVREDKPARGYRPMVWHLNARGKLAGATMGASHEVPIEIRVDGKSEWILAAAAGEAEKPATFEFDAAPCCTEGRIAKIALFNPATGAEALRSPLGVFVSGENHFLFADPWVSDEACRAVLTFWKDGRRRALSLARRKSGTLEPLARVDIEDASHARFDGRHNTFSLSLDVLGEGGILILDEDGTELGVLPTLAEILDFVRRIAVDRDDLVQRIEPYFGADPGNDALLDDMRRAWEAGDRERARRYLLMAAARALDADEIEALFRAAGELALK